MQIQACLAEKREELYVGNQGDATINEKSRSSWSFLADAASWVSSKRSQHASHTNIESKGDENSRTRSFSTSKLKKGTSKIESKTDPTVLCIAVSTWLNSNIPIVNRSIVSELPGDNTNKCIGWLPTVFVRELSLLTRHEQRELPTK